MVESGSAVPPVRVLRDVLVLLSGQPSAAQVVAALAAGPLAPLHPRRTVVWRIDGMHLLRHAVHPPRPTGRPGAGRSGVVRERPLSLRSNLPAALAIRQDETLVLRRAVAGTGGGTAGGAAFRVRVPIRSRGRVVGAYGADGDAPWTVTPAGLALLDAAGDALALWLTRPDVTGEPVPGAPASADGEPCAVCGSRSGCAARTGLTRRQVRILELVAAGRTNAAIAAAIGRSASTVKADLQGAMDLLGVANRRQAAARATSVGLIGAGHR